MLEAYEPGMFHIPVPIQTFLDLSAYMEEIKSKCEIGDFAGKAIDEWIAQARSRSPKNAGKRLVHGYQWKDLFLPSGTRLRTAFRREHFHATVQGDHIVFRGEKLSPSEFANSVGGVGRNPWRVLWILLPHDRTWSCAASLRTGQRLSSR